MKHKNPTKISLILVALVCGLVGSYMIVRSFSQTPGSGSETAKQADAFVDSIGVNTHLNYSDGVYANYAQVKAALTEVGIRHIRDYPVPPVNSEFNDLAASGIKLDAIMGTAAPRSWMPYTLDQLYTNVRDQLPTAVGSVEGANEWDINGDPDWAANLRANQQALWNKMKSSPITSSIPVFGPSIVIDDNTATLGNISSWADYGNVHPYPGGRPPSMTVNEQVAASKTNNVAGKPVVATETGYHTAINVDSSVGHRPASEAAEAVYMPRLFLYYYAQGLPHTFTYELVDQGTDLADSEQSFGIVRHDFSRKPAFTALKNLIALLKDPGPAFTPQSLNYNLAGGDANTNKLLLQKRDGSFWLAVWQETSVWDQVNLRTLNPAGVPVTLTLPNAAPMIQTYAPNQGTTALTTKTNTNSLAFTSSAQVTLIQVSPGTTTPPPTPPVTQPDLVVTDLSWTPTAPKAGDHVSFTATIKNQGNAATPAGIVHGVGFDIGGQVINWSDTSNAPLAPGESRTLTANNGTTGTSYWVATQGSYSLTANVDDVNRIANESDETNNALSKTLVVSAATPFASTSFWNTALPASTPTDSNTANYISWIKQDLTAYSGYGDINTDSYTPPIYTVPSGTSTTAFKFNDCQNKSSTPTDLLAQLSAVPVPSYAVPSAGTDEEMVIYQPSTDTEWETWGTQHRSDGWYACWGGRITNVSQSNGIFPAPYGVTASGLPMLGGTIRASELQTGVINHAIGFSIIRTGSRNVASSSNDTSFTNSFVWPANRDDGYNNNASAPVEGTRFRLDPTVNVSSLGLTPTAAAIATAAQKYGIVLWDTSGNVGFRAENSAEFTSQGQVNPYTSIFGSTPSYNQLKGFPWDKLQALPAGYGKSTTSVTPPTDTTSPVVSFTTPANNATVSGIVTATANASDDTSVSKVNFYLDGSSSAVITDTSSPYSYSFDSKTLTNGSHTITAKAYDTAGNTGSATVTVNVSNLDTTAPNAPANLQATAPNATTVNLSWTASTDTGANPTGVTKYNVLRNGVVIAQPTTLSYADTNLTANTSYSYVIQAVDGASNVSANSTAAVVKTPGAIDTTLPTTPTNLTATLASTTQVNLAWNTSTDSGGSGLAGYNVYRGGIKLNSSLITTSSYGDTTVASGTAYGYQVEAVDGSGNKSAKTATVTVTTSSSERGDVTGPTGAPDGKIDIQDVSYEIRNYNTTNARGDVTGPNGAPDGKVDIYDLSYIIRNYGK